MATPTPGINLPNYPEAILKALGLIHDDPQEKEIDNDVYKSRLVPYQKGSGVSDKLVLSNQELEQTQTAIQRAINEGNVDAIAQYEDLLVSLQVTHIQTDGEKSGQQQATKQAVKAIANNKRYLEEAKRQAADNYEKITGKVYLPATEAKATFTDEEIKDYFDPSKFNSPGDLKNISNSNNERNKKFYAILPDAIKEDGQGGYNFDGKTLDENQVTELVKEWQSKTGLKQNANGEWEKPDPNAKKVAFQEVQDPDAAARFQDGGGSASGSFSDFFTKGGVKDFNGSYADKPDEDDPLVFIGDNKDGTYGEKNTAIKLSDFNRLWDTFSEEQRTQWADKLARLGMGATTSLETKQAWQQYGQLLAQNYANGTGIEETPDQVFKKQASQPGVGALSAEENERQVATATTQQLLQFAQANGMSLSEQEIGNQVGRVIDGKATIDTIVDGYRNTIASKYPSYGDRLRSGEDLSTIAGSYISQMAETLELNPEDVDVTDPTIQQALQPLDNNGNPATGGMPLWEFDRRLKQDDRYYKTKAAVNSYSQLASAIGKSFGMDA